MLDKYKIRDYANAVRLSFLLLIQILLHSEYALQLMFRLGIIPISGCHIPPIAQNRPRI